MRGVRGISFLVSRYLFLAGTALGILVSSPAAEAGGLCGAGSPALPVEEFREGVRVWPNNFSPVKPSQQLPADRDSTSYTSFGTFPTFAFGHELFQSLDIVDDRLYMLYGAGLQVWDIGPGKEEMPVREDVADALAGHWHAWGHFGEVDTWTYSVDAMEDPNAVQDDMIATAGDLPAGVALWINRPGVDSLTQAYQDDSIKTRMIRMAELNGTVWAFAASDTSDGGLAVYDLTRARTLAPCFDNAALAGRQCSNVYRGLLGDLERVTRYVAVTEKGGKLWVAVSDGSRVSSRPLKLDIFEVADPAFPQFADLRYSGGGLNPDIRDIRGLEFFDWNGSTYLALVENYIVEIYDVDSCLDANGCTSLGAPTVSLPVSSQPGEAQLLTFSMAGTTPYLYYSLFSDLFSGTQKEFLWDLSNLGGTNVISEVTDGGAHYTDTCNSLQVDYWGDYYQLNDFGLRNAVPNQGRFSGNYFYRAARGIFDIHQLAGNVSAPKYTTNVVTPSPQWFKEPITFTATATNCSTAQAGWQWSASDTVVTGGLGPGAATNAITWAECAAADCPDKTIEVWALNDDSVCTGNGALIQDRANILVQDRRPHIRSFSVSPVGSPPGTYPVCTEITVDAVVDGKTPFSYSWNIEDSTKTTVASGTSFPIVWDTTGIDVDLPEQIFSDGFESGNTNAWSSGLLTRGVPASEVFTVSLQATNPNAESDIDTLELTLTALGALGFGVPALTFTDQGNAQYNFAANTESATEWRWEFEDPANGSTSGCMFYTTCQIYDWGVDDADTSFTWTSPNVAGNYGVTLAIRNCVEGQTTPLTAAVTVAVDNITAPDPPVITGFMVNVAASPTCSPCDQFGCFCTVGSSITFDVTFTGTPDTLEFDWEPNGNFDSTFLVTVPVTHTFTSTGVADPNVRAVDGAQMSPPFSLQDSLFIIN